MAPVLELAVARTFFAPATPGYDMMVGNMLQSRSSVSLLCLEGGRLFLAATGDMVIMPLHLHGASGFAIRRKKPVSPPNQTRDADLGQREKRFQTP